MPAYGEPRRHWHVVETEPLPGKFAIMVYRSDLVMRDHLDEVMILLDETCGDQPTVPLSPPEHERGGPLDPAWQRRIDDALRNGGGEQ